MQSVITSKYLAESRRKTILLVEDEVITSMAQVQFLTNSGYNVISAADGETAVDLALGNGMIDLVLMDIDLGQGIDGTQAAGMILRKKDIPILFLSSHSEEEMVRKVKNVTRYGYVVKNSGEFVLLSSIEMAFELFEAHSKTREREEHLDVTLQSIADCVISTDHEGKIVKMNRAAEQLTGWSFADAAGCNLYDVFHVAEEENSPFLGLRFIESDAASKTGERRRNLILISRNGGTYRISKSSSPIMDNSGRIMGRVLVFRNITGEYEAHRTLMERSALMRGLFENMPSGVVIYRIRNNGVKASDYIVTDVNSSTEKIIRQERGGLIGKALSEIIPDIEKFGVLQFYRRVWETGNTEHFPSKVYKNDKVAAWYNNYAFKLPTGEIVTIFNNVSEQKKAEEALRESEARYRLLADNTADIIWTSDLDLNFTYSSPSVLRIRGYTPEEVLAQSVRDTVAPESREIVNFILQDILEKDRAGRDSDSIKAVVLEHIHKNGSKLWLESSLSFMRDGNGAINGLLGVTRNINDRKKAEDALLKSEEKLHLIMDGIPAYLAYLDSSEKFVYVNKAYADWIGKAKEDFTGKHIKEVLPNDYYLKAEPYYKRVLGGERVVYDNIHTGTDGVERHARVEYVPHVSGDSVIGFFAMTLDVTEQQKSTKKVLTLLKEKELLLKEVHHRIKNNMGSIASLLYLQSDTLEEPSAVVAIQDARSRVLSMMGIYEMLYKSEDYRSVSVSGYMNDLIEKISSTYMGNSRIMIQKQIDDFSLDSSLLFPAGMIVNELLTNALKYAFPSGRTGSICVKVHKNGGRAVELSVKDSGVGLPDSGIMSRSRGFGLSLVNMLVQQVNGKLSIIKNGGTEFRITFLTI